MFDPIGMEKPQVSDYLLSLVRTYVPLGVGVLVTWLASYGIQIDSTATAALAAGVGAIVSAALYALIRAAERRWPRLGALLGVPKAPTYHLDAKRTGAGTFDAAPPTT